jgi:hypothetical protein
MFGWDSKATENQSCFELLHKFHQVRIMTFIPENREFRTQNGIFPIAGGAPGFNLQARETRV